MHREPTPMDKRIYISVILPLRLEWEPCYWTDIEDIGPGQRVRVLFAGREYTGTVSAAGIEPQLAPSKIQQVISREDNMAGILPEEIRLWRILAGYYMCTVGEVYKTAYPAGKINSEKSLAKKKAALQEDGQKRKGKTEAGEKTDIGLSSPQQAALQQIQEAFSHERTVLLNGVTGSGQTEIYISLASETLSRGKDVLYLVPEKAMSRQLEERLRRHFGDSLLTFHSGETASRKAVTADRLRTSNGESHIVLGTRSAIFLPFHGLGLVVVDEEHDSSYKQDSPAPRYNGRDAAIMLAAIQREKSDGGLNGNGHAGKCNVILGSATPSLESLYNCMSGKYAEVRLDSRYYDGGMTDVEIIDTIAERKKRGMEGSFSRKLIARINDTLSSGRQVLLLRTRRGYSTVLQCSECGFIPKCPRCNVSLTYHKDSGRAVCHHCGYAIAKPDSCPQCGGSLKELGAGTQKIEEEVAVLFPSARTARLDSDSAQSRSYASETVRKFGKGEIDILIGTQIITKGFDFGNLALVAVLQADAMLGIQDFRADEKAVQTLAQFKGRCGRRGGKSLFVIQTAQPEHPVYQVLAQDGPGPVQDFISELLSERAEFRYPPYTRIIDIVIKDRNEERADRMCRALAIRLEGFDVTGPYTPASGKIADEFLKCLRITMPKDRTLADRKAALKKTIENFETTRNYSGHITLNVDPA